MLKWPNLSALYIHKSNIYLCISIAFIYTRIAIQYSAFRCMQKTLMCSIFFLTNFITFFVEHGWYCRLKHIHRCENKTNKPNMHINRHTQIENKSKWQRRNKRICMDRSVKICFVCTNLCKAVHNLKVCTIEINSGWEKGILRTVNDVHRNIEYSTLMYDYGCNGIKSISSNSSRIAFRHIFFFIVALSIHLRPLCWGLRSRTRTPFHFSSPSRK